MPSTAEILGPDAAKLLSYESKFIPRSTLHLPGPDFVERVISQSDRNPTVLRNFQHMLNTGRLAGSGYLSILPVDQGIEHSAGASFAPNPAYFDPENIVKLAIEGGCNAVASTIGSIGAMEAIKTLAGFGQTLSGRLLSVNLREMKFHTLPLLRDPACAVCSALH
jgi:class I fructose-bisphosphate aldolase